MKRKKTPGILKEKKVSQVFLEYCGPLLDDLSDEDARERL